MRHLPEVCAEGIFASVISQSVESLVALFVPLMGGMILVGADDGVSTCEGAEYNAISVCFIIEADAQLNVGIGRRRWWRR